MPDFLIRNVSSEVLALGRKLALRRRRPLQKELLEIVEEAVRFRAGLWAARADRIRARLQRGRRRFSDSARLLREDRRR